MSNHADDHGERLASVETTVQLIHESVKRIDSKISNGLSSDMAILKDDYEKRKNWNLKIWGGIGLSLACAVIAVIFSLSGCGKAMPNNHNAVIEWDYDYVNNLDIDSFWVYELNADSTRRRTVGSVHANELSLPVLVPADGDTHYFAVTAVDTAGNESGYSNIAKDYFEEMDTDAPDSPRNSRIIRLN